MPPRPGETLLTTLFGDVHYYFGAPSTKPVHHRFDRGSYVYLFHNAAENRAKLEIANHAGTPDQDAFSGYLDIANVTYSHKQPTLFTIEIDGASLQGHDQWHLPSYNEKNEQKYLYKIHTLDIYLWTENDGSAFLKHLRTVLPASKVDVRDAPPTPSPAEHQDSMSSVVQQLERTAVSPQFTPQRQESTASQQSQPAPPPTASPAPLAYNPAAPAAPEPIAHREKTPPPPDAESGTGLNNAAKYDSVPYGNVPNTFGGPQSQPTHHQAYFAGPPQQARTSSMSSNSFPGPPGATPPASGPRPHSGSIPAQPGSRSSSQQYAPTFAGPPGSQPTSPPPTQHSFSTGTRQPSFGPQSTPSFGPNAIASPGLQHSATPPGAPPGYSPGHFNANNPHDYGHYDYNAAQAAQPYGTYGSYMGDIHNQAYRPTAEEAAHGHGSHGKKEKAAPAQQGSDTRARIEQRVQSVESKVGRFLKKIDRGL